VSLDSAPDYAAAGADLISVGAITHSAPVLDLGLDLEEA
jgi:nicotinate-nucleotide pyrophosphorylase (carboxylating)